ncbi:endoglucanase 15 [Phtheirospermum japonicum]|uniref:cellulase n=1 Tax=Phtheirospermum japonicum TaxID=374723 RepID=A0A830BR56_9LAMI|nr:endoglucanase 15 [Phtheirospermum japonicum]
MAFTITIMSWSIIEYRKQIVQSGELKNALDALKWGTDYLIKAHPQPDVLYGEVPNFSLSLSLLFFWHTHYYLLENL